jgi:hypothetical protein
MLNFCTLIGVILRDMSYFAMVACLIMRFLKCFLCGRIAYRLAVGLLSFEVFMEMGQGLGVRDGEFVVWAMLVPDCILLFIDNLLRVYIRGL